MRRLVLALCALLLSTPILAGSVPPRDGWAVHDSDLTHGALFDNLKVAVKAQGLIIVTRAGPTKAAANRGITIPDNMVVGVYNNDYAVRALALSTAAMIEAPIRFYLTGDEDGTATLSYKLPSTVFAPYFDEGGQELRALAAELDTKFAAIAKAAVK